MIRFPEKFRMRTGKLASPSGGDGAFMVQLPNGDRCFVIAYAGWGWEHVSVSLSRRCPTWEETCFVKKLFWESEDCVVQYHPPKSEYVNCHPYCLHLWRSLLSSMPRPPAWMVGPVGPIQQDSGTVTASPESSSQPLDCGAAAQTRTGDLLITNQPTGSAIFPSNQVLSELSASPRPVEYGAQDSSTYADVTASPGASSEGAQ